MTKTVLEGYVVQHVRADELFQLILAQLPTLGVDDSYYGQQAPIYVLPFEGGKKMRVTIEDI